MLKNFKASASKHPGATLAVTGIAGALLGMGAMRLIDKYKGNPGDKTMATPPTQGTTPPPASGLPWNVSRPHAHTH